MSQKQHLLFKSKDQFKYYEESTKEGADSMNLGEGVEYNYYINKSKKQITTTMIYNESVFDYSSATDEEKEHYLASNLIKSMEDAGATCKFIEITKQDLRKHIIVLFILI